MFFSSTPPLFETKKTQSHTRQLVNPFFSKTFGLKKNFPKKSFCAKPQQLTSFQGWPLDPPIPGSHDENTPKKWSRITPPSLGHEWNWTVGLNGSTKSRKMPRRNISSFFFTHISLATPHLTHGMLSKEFWCQGAEVWIGSHSGGRFLLRLVPIMTIATVEVVGTW